MHMKQYITLCVYVCVNLKILLSAIADFTHLCHLFFYKINQLNLGDFGFFFFFLNKQYY